jgi:hypothetical protein
VRQKEKEKKERRKGRENRNNNKDSWAVFVLPSSPLNDILSLDTLS